MTSTDRVNLIIAAQEREFPKLDCSAEAIADRLVRLGTLFIEAIGRVSHALTLGCKSRVYEVSHFLFPVVVILLDDS